MANICEFNTVKDHISDFFVAEDKKKIDLQKEQDTI